MSPKLVQLSAIWKRLSWMFIDTIVVNLHTCIFCNSWGLFSIRVIKWIICYLIPNYYRVVQKSPYIRTTEIIQMAGSGSCRKVAMNFNRKHVMYITQGTVAKQLRSSRRLEVLQTNWEMVVHMLHLIKVQWTWCWVHLQGVTRKHTKVGCRKWCQKIEYHAHF
jgi:hypothetical protein